MTRTPILSALLSLALVLPGTSAAQASADGSPAPPETPTVTSQVTVTARPILEGTEIGSGSVPVTTVSSKQIDDLFAPDIAAALRLVPGVVIARYDPIGGYGGGDGGAIMIRGQGSGRPGAEIATLTDGLPRFVGVWTHPLLDNLNVDMADRIEVTKSAQPVTLGNMSFGAVDVIPARRTEAGFGGRVLGSWGTFSTGTARADVSGKSGDVDFWVNGTYRQSDGHRENADGKTSSFYGRLGYDLASGWSVALQYNRTYGKASDPGQLGAPPSPVVPSFSTTDDFGWLTLAHKTGPLEGSLKLYYDGGSIDWLQSGTAGSVPFVTETNWKNYGFRLKERWAAWTGGEVLFGVDDDLYGGESREVRPAVTGPYAGARLRNTAPWAQVSQSFRLGAVELVPSAGARYNASADFGGVWGGQAGVKAIAGATTFYANWSRGFNLPGAWTAAMYAGFGRGDQWTTLRPERMSHFEAGVSWKATSRWTLSAAWFYDDVTDALRFAPPPPPPPQFVNVGAYLVRGVEAQVSVAPTPALSLYGGGTWLSASPETTPNAPEWSLSAGVAWTPLKLLRLNADAQYVGSMYVVNPRFPAPTGQVGAYALVNARAGYSFPLGPALVEAFVAGENLLDRDYSVRPGYPMPGRGVSAGLDARF